MQDIERLNRVSNYIIHNQDNFYSLKLYATRFENVSRQTLLNHSHREEVLENEYFRIN